MKYSFMESMQFQNDNCCRNVRLCTLPHAQMKIETLKTNKCIV